MENSAPNIDRESRSYPESEDRCRSREFQSEIVRNNSSPNGPLGATSGVPSPHGARLSCACGERARQGHECAVTASKFLRLKNSPSHEDSSSRLRKETDPCSARGKVREQAPIASGDGGNDDDDDDKDRWTSEEENAREVEPAKWLREVDAWPVCLNDCLLCSRLSSGRRGVARRNGRPARSLECA